eukprot:m.1446706 g.1446706  ORF g.1446706 m.1446706 type:complete len:581 (-) comp25107_c0_seq89:1247-2989(-)
MCVCLCVCETGCARGWFAVRPHRLVDSDATSASAAITDAEEQRPVVYMSGAFPGWYPAHLRLKVAQRDLFLIDEDVLVVVDHIGVSQTSPIVNVTACFNRFFWGGQRNDKTVDAFAITARPLDETMAKKDTAAATAGYRRIHFDIRDHATGWQNYSLDFATTTETDDDTTEADAFVPTPQQRAHFHLDHGVDDQGKGTIHYARVTSSVHTSKINRKMYVIAPTSRRVSTLRLSENSNAGVRVAFDLERNGKPETVTISATLRDGRYNHIQSKAQFLGFLGASQVEFASGGAIRFGEAHVSRTCHPSRSTEDAPGYSSTANAVLTSDLTTPLGARECEPFDVARAMHGLQHKLTLSPVVSAPKNFIYCGIPKCGVSRWRRLLRRIEGNPDWRDNKAHRPQDSGLVYLANLSASDAHAFANAPATLSFVVVRNPFTRLLSGWLDKTQVQGFHMQLSSNFTEFVQQVRDTPADELDEHFRPMTSFCGISNGMRFDVVARNEDIDVWGPQLVQRLNLTAFTSTGWRGAFFPAAQSDKEAEDHNRHANDRVREFYTPEAERLVRSIYRDDFDVFGYSTQLADAIA